MVIVHELPQMIQALLDPRAYPERPAAVELVQTQMSFLFLTDEYVYKVKKPVDLGYLDYTTLDKRLYFCRQEVMLNRRLCPDTYLGVMPITREGGNYLLEGGGEAVEYAVKMHRLPRTAMMDVLLAENQLSTAMIDTVARKLAGFHERAETDAAISAFGSLDTIARNNAENFTQAQKFIGNTLSPETYKRIKSYTEAFIRDNAPLFQRRVDSGRIRDCHGDLHAAHICFTNDICIYDCIEFNDRFRHCDVASEVAFLAMDLDHYGRADLAQGFIGSYIEHSRDEELVKLLKFYRCYRACVRGKVESFKLDDPYIDETGKGRIRDTAAGYFHLAAAYTWLRPILLITTGLVGTGKSTLAQELAQRFGLTVISSDITRKDLAGIAPNERRYEGFDDGIYSDAFSRMTYDKMFTNAKHILGTGQSVILDASFIRAEERTRARELAQRVGAAFLLIECTLDEETILKRLKEREKTPTVSDGRPEILTPQREVFQPVTEMPPGEHIIIDTSQPLAKLLNEVSARISSLAAI